jgi:hypothetical protein
MTSKKRHSNQNAAEPAKPRDLLPIEKIILQEAERMVKIRADGVDQEITAEEVVIRKLIQTGAAGSPHALGHIVRYLTKAQAAKAEIIERDVATGHRVKAGALALLAKTKAAGKDPKLCAPHPDDLTVTENIGWEIKGPADQQELAALLKRRDNRDLFIAQAYLEERLATTEEWRNAGDNTELRPDTSARVMADLIDITLPKRFQLTINDHMEIDRKYLSMTKCELLKYMSEAWRTQAISPLINRGVSDANKFPVAHACRALPISSI